MNKLAADATAGKIANLFNDGKNLESLTIIDLANWRSSESGSKLRLPPIQRSIVWNNEQIINYWDSLLRGYPAGMMMVHRVQTGHVGQDEDGKTSVADNNDFQLFDGQQRLTSVLLGLGRGQMKNGRKLWVDFTQPKPSSGLCFQLRINSTGQPFGYKAESPNQKFELGKRHAKWNEEKWKKVTPREAFSKVNGEDLIDSECAVPLAEVCEFISKNSREETVVFLKENGAASDLAEQFVIALDRALKSIVVLQEVAPELVANQDEYIRFFGRLGQGGTRLSDDELTYSIIKQQYPKIHDQMLKIMHGDVGRIASEVDLVLASIRVSKTLNPWENSQEWEVIGRPNPSSVIQLRDKVFVLKKFFELIPNDSDRGELEVALGGIRQALLFDASTHVAGLPAMLLARLPMELVDTLLLVSIKRGAEAKWESEDRNTLCALVLYWLLFIRNDGKAAWRVFQHVRKDDWVFSHSTICKLVKEFEDEEIASFIPGTTEINELQKEVNAGLMGENILLRPWSDRFKAADRVGERKPGDALRILSTNRELITRALMWIQRNYLTENFNNYDPTSDRDDDLPIDLDHIIPSSIFDFNWKSVRSHLHEDAITDNFWRNRSTIGNSLGNFRWLDARVNRGRGNGAYEPLKKDADFVASPDDWNSLIPQDGKDQLHWSKEDIAKFQRLIDSRTLELYRIILNEGCISRLLSCT